MSWLRLLIRLPSYALIGIVRLYQLVISPWIGPRCRFHPTCSQYSIQVLRKYGLFVGVWKTFVRLSKCHPWHPGGHDPA